MDINKIQSADILDILFDGRNKEYGAYDLRKTYNKRIKYLDGRECSLICVLIPGIGSLIANSTKKAKTELVVAEVTN